MILNTRTLWLAFLVAFGLISPSTPAQRSKFPPYVAKAANGNAPADLAPQRVKTDGVKPNEIVNNCAYQFTTGSGITYLQFCVTVNGNISEFQSPANVEQLNPGDVGAYEGYGICDVTTSTSYYDYEFGDSGNWNPATKVSQTGTQVKIERITSDGNWTLTQTISLIAGVNPYAKISMALKNNSSKPKTALLLRYANPLPDNAGTASGNFYESYDGTENSAWGYTATNSSSGADPVGLMLQLAGDPIPATVPFKAEGFAITATAPSPCDAFANLASPITNNFGTIVYIYQVELNKEQAVTVNNRYMTF